MISGRVYRCYAADGELLYVGTTISPVATRLDNHRTRARRQGKSLWINSLARVEVDEYPDWRQAIVAEAALIAALQPTHNQIHKSGRLPSVAHLYTDIERLRDQQAAERKAAS